MKAFTLKLVALSLSLVSTTALAQQRLVVSYLEPELSAMSAAVTLNAEAPKHCFRLSQGKKWCVPKPAAGKVFSQQYVKQNSRFTSAHITVPEELSVIDAQQLLSQSGLYAYVERDIEISNTQSSWNEITPNDESFSLQTFFSDNSEQSPTASSVLRMWRMLQSPQVVSHVYVLDAGFVLHDDISYADGFNFVTMIEGEVRSPGFLEKDFGDGSCKNSHGSGVAGVIAASIDNSLHIAGINGAVSLHPLRVMNCGSGLMSDAAAALDWLSGDTLDNLPAFNGKPGVINMSLGGKVGAQSCPFYLQNAIDKATAKGFTIVVAAGNQSDDAKNYIPAKCNNVITVGAATAGDHYNPADIASFSNYGEGIDIMAMGQSVPGLMRDNKLGFWDGTSFASPIVAGVLSVIQKDFNFTAENWRLLTHLSGVSRWSDNSRCDMLGCGAGILDAAILYINAKRLDNGELNAATFVLNAVPACRHRWMLQHLPQGTSLCDQVSVEVNTFIDQSDSDVIRVSASDSNNLSPSEELNWIGDFTTKRFVVNKANVLGKVLYAQLCDSNTGDCSAPVRINTNALDNIPAVCQ